MVGENCHIVGEKPSSPRGKSSLTSKDRNRYPNLILLCAEHHTIVDDDPTAWPIELLHQIKADHELWAENLVPDDMGGEIGKLYATLVNRATQCLLLENWPWLTDNAIRDLLPEEFVDGVRKLAIDVECAVWPGKHTALETALKNVAHRATGYVDAFLELGYLDGHDWFRQDLRWKRQFVSDYDERMKRSDAWHRRCTRLLFNLTHALNEFAAEVRSTIQPTYFFHEGKFYVLDSLGVMSNMEGSVYFPNGYEEDD